MAAFSARRHAAFLARRTPLAVGYSNKTIESSWLKGRVGGDQRRNLPFFRRRGSCSSKTSTFFNWEAIYNLYSRPSFNSLDLLAPRLSSLFSACGPCFISSYSCLLPSLSPRSSTLSFHPKDP
ncbi:hypothetical protein AMTR_s00034p00134810 [Amborella trichopoda]|uniref:Uncharacterized protein n=1 Tax=Amborella trichopoda TaxID=13333 RepID=W1PWG1_AMBTC|nr:hypothetical protein AMTR_s00034p00134810 [Amborella trichopoda]